MSNREEVQAALDKLTNTPIYAYCQELREENTRLREALETIVILDQQYGSENLYETNQCRKVMRDNAAAALEGKP
jgi:hypothetical protein